MVMPPTDFKIVLYENDRSPEAMYTALLQAGYLSDTAISDKNGVIRVILESVKNFDSQKMGPSKVDLIAGALTNSLYINSLGKKANRCD